jgi:hypothetical protein
VNSERQQFRSSGAAEFHRRALSEPDVRVSHPALWIVPSEPSSNWVDACGRLRSRHRALREAIRLGGVAPLTLVSQPNSPSPAMARIVRKDMKSSRAPACFRSREALHPLRRTTRLRACSSRRMRAGLPAERRYKALVMSRNRHPCSKRRQTAKSALIFSRIGPVSRAIAPWAS